MQNGNEWLTVAEIADHLRVSKMTVYRMIKEGELPAVTINSRTIRVRRQEFLDYLTHHQRGGKS